MKLKVCKNCKQEKSFEDFYWYNKNKGYKYSVCKECHKARVQAEQWRKRPRPSHEERKARAVINGIKSRHKDTTLTVEWLVERIKAGTCEVTGLPFKLNVQGSGRNPYTPSVDRVDPTKGYHPENCKVVVWIYSAAKMNWTHEDVLILAKALLS